MKKALCTLLAILLLPAFAFAEEALTARSVFDMAQTGDYASIYALADESVRKAISEEELGEIFSSLDAAFGQVKGCEEEQISLADPYRITALPVHYEKATVALYITWQGNRIAGLHYSVIDTAPETQSELPEGIWEEGIRVGEPVLEGYITLPADAAAPLPAVVLLHGSGASDRDETIQSTKMFRDLAYGLAPLGIAAARYDKRTYVYQTYTQEELNVFSVREESIQDAVAAAQLLRSDPRIDPNRIYLIGHSMGAMLAPRIASENPGLFAGIILLSGTPKTLADIIISQNQALADALPPLQKLAGNMQVTAMRQAWKNVLQAGEEEVKGKTIFNQPAYYFWEMAQYDTGKILQSLDIPALIINGGQDFQIVDADGIEAWQASGLPESVQLSYYPELNHLLMNPQAPENMRGTVSEYQIPCHVSEEIIDEIASFILK